MLSDITSYAIVAVPLLAVISLALYSRRYIRDVADYLVAGRVAGRYVLTVAGMEGAIGLTLLIADSEVRYKTGFSVEFWRQLMMPMALVISLTGFVAYRWRETKVMSMGQFLEMRYSRSLRIFAMVIRSISELLTNCIGPAVAARFFIYLLGLPHTVDICGVPVQTFFLLVMAVLFIAVILVLAGGQISLMVTDCLQGLMCYPIFVIFTVFILTEFSWWDEITPVLFDRAAGESFMNPYDINSLRDFNMFAIVVSLTARMLNVGVWFGTGGNSAAKTAHEAKMSGILGAWREGFARTMILLFCVGVIVFMNHANYVKPAHKTRTYLLSHVAGEVIADKQLRKKITEGLKDTAAVKHIIGQDKPLANDSDVDTPYLDNIHYLLLENVEDKGEANALFQNIRSLYYQMMLPAAAKHFLPKQLIALLVLLGLLLMISTDDSRIFSSAAVITQDLIIPFRKTQFTPEQHIRCLKAMVIAVAVIFAVGSLYLSQLDYLRLFIQITTAIWLGGAGSVVTFGLYSRWGTTAGAYASVIAGATISGGGMLAQRTWASHIYPLLEQLGWVKPLGKFLDTVSAPFSPYIVWEMNPTKFPVNSYEMYFGAIILSVASYCFFSWLTYKKPYNLDQLLHRGIYNLDGENKNINQKFTWKKIFNYFISITPDYTRGDKIITWSMFIYSFVYKFLIVFVAIVVWNAISPWPQEWWGWKFYITAVVVPLIVGIISTVWFSIGGVYDLRQLFRDLATRKRDALDNGFVEGGVSLADKNALEKIEHSAQK